MEHLLVSGDPGHNISIDWEADEDTQIFLLLLIL